jgi:hypothetical protein
MLANLTATETADIEAILGKLVTRLEELSANQ